MQIQKIQKLLFEQLKNENQDFEFYPTTNEILDAIMQNKGFVFGDVESILDIGCGNGKALDFFSRNLGKKVSIFGIEKSQILISNLVNPDILILGSDFDECMMLDKKVDLVFSNPPYKEFKEWTTKILNYTIAKRVILVIPERWRNDGEIVNCIKESGWVEHSIGKFDFLESEDRKARAKVEVIVFSRNQRSEKVFERELSKAFGMGELLESIDSVFWEKDKLKKETDSVCKDLVSAQDLIDYLINRYKSERERLNDSLLSLAKVGAELMSDLGVSKSSIIEAVIKRLQFLKNSYWREIINRIPEITKRLTTDQRNDLLRDLANRGAEFNKSNILGVILFAINVAKKCEQENFILYWERLSSIDFRRKYRSNEKAFGEAHRYEKPDKIHEGKLDYRIIVDYAGTFYSAKDFLHHCRAVIDLEVIARSLGYDGDFRLFYPNGEQVEPNFKGILVPLGESFIKVGDNQIARAKVFQNGNLHIFFDQKFLAKLNLNVFRILGWVKNKEEAKKEFKKDMREDEIEDFFKQETPNFLLEIK